MFKPGKRQLRDITDQELRAIVEMSGHYGHKDYWGNFTITDIDRDLFRDCIVIDYEQTRISDGEKSLTVMFFDYNSLTYHVDYRYPYSRQGDRKSLTANPKMLLWLLNQDFDLLPMLTEKPVSLHEDRMSETLGFFVTKGYCNCIDLEHAKFFENDKRDDAEEYMKEQKEQKNYVNLFRVLGCKNYDRDFILKDKHYERMEHCIGLDGGDVKDGLYKAYRNGVTYNECVPEWEDLVRNGYARRYGDLQCVFYSVTRKGFEAVARRNRIRIRYEIEVNP